MLHYVVNTVVPLIITAHQAGYYTNDWFALVDYVDAALTKWAFKSRSK